jgi:hypothetical protein
VYAAPGTDQLRQILALSQARGAGWLYVTDLGGDNPYAGPPTYWNAEAAKIANEGIQALYATARPASTDESGNAVPAKISFRWKSLQGTHWQILISDGSQRVVNESAAGAVVVPTERIEVDADGRVRVFRQGRDSGDKDWVEVNAHAVAYLLEEHVHLVESDSRGLGESVTYQIRSFDGENRVLSSSGPIPLSVTGTQYIFDLTDH